MAPQTMFSYFEVFYADKIEGTLLKHAVIKKRLPHPHSFVICGNGVNADTQQRLQSQAALPIHRVVIG